MRGAPVTGSSSPATHSYKCLLRAGAAGSEGGGLAGAFPEPRTLMDRSPVVLRAPLASPCLLEVHSSAFHLRTLTRPQLPLLGHCRLPTPIL